MTYLANRKKWIALLACSLTIVLFSGVAFGSGNCSTQGRFEGCTDTGQGTTTWWYGASTTEVVNPPQSWLFLEVWSIGNDLCDIDNADEMWDSGQYRVANTWLAGWTGDAQYDQSGCDSTAVLLTETQHYAFTAPDVWRTSQSISHPGRE